MDDLSKNPLLDGNQTEISKEEPNRVVGFFFTIIHTIKQTIFQLKSIFDAVEVKDTDERIKWEMEQQRESLESIRRAAEAQRQSTRVRGSSGRDMGGVLQNTSDRKAAARKTVQVAIRRSAPWVQGSRSPFE